MSKPKLLRDLPQFVVSAVHPGQQSATGPVRFELDGTFDRRIDDIDPHWFWLLLGDRDCLCASLRSLDKESWVATVSCDLSDEPQLVGKSLAYLSPRWQAYNVWMVLDPTWGWEKKRFQGADAVAEDYDAGKTSIIDGREVRVWTKLELVGEREGASQHYPASDQTLPPSPGLRAVPGGWGHEHCDLCKAHIEVGESGYCDPGGRWICEKCYARYVMRRDLAFLDEL